MKIGPLGLFRRRHSNGRPIPDITVASWHWAWSLTWRWVLVWQSPHGQRWFWPRFHHVSTYRGMPGRPKWCGHTSLFMPLVGSLHLQSQPNMRH